MPFISYGDYLNANQGDVGNMEKMLRNEEQAQLSAALGSTNAAGREAKDSAYWGGSGEVSDYAAWKDSESKRAAARDFQSDIQNDAGQLNQLNKLGKGFGSLDAAFALGSNKTEKTRASLAEYMGYDAQKLDELASKYGDETEAARKDYDRELAAKTESDKKTAERGKYDSERKASEDEYWRLLESEVGRLATPASREEMHKFMADSFMGKNPALPNQGVAPDSAAAHSWNIYTGNKGQGYGKGDRRYLESARDALMKEGRFGLPSAESLFSSVFSGRPAEHSLSSLDAYYRSKGQGGPAPEDGNYRGRLAYGGRSGWDQEKQYRDRYGELGGINS